MAKARRPAKPTRGLWPFGRRRRRDAPLNMGDDYDLLAAEGFAPEIQPTLGQRLRAARLEKGLTLEDVAETTRVRRAYLEALEEDKPGVLPSRPFTIGYVRAYAIALGLEPDAMVAQFKEDEPAQDDRLQNPVGVPEERDPRVAAFVVGAIVIVAAIMTWNIAQRAMTAAAPPPTKASDERASKVLANAVKAGPIELGAPLPAPIESTIPPPYETPGLAEHMGLKVPGAPAAATSPKANEDPLAALRTLPSTFTALGQVYDAGPRLTSVVTIQAVKPGLLIARGADGSVYFARQLAKGDAYRVPQVAGLTLDVSSPQDFQVFVAGQSKGLLPAPQVLAAKLVAPAAGVTAPSSAVPVPPPAPAEK